MKTIWRIFLILAVVAGISALMYVIATASGWTSVGRRVLESQLYAGGEAGLTATESHGAGRGQGQGQGQGRRHGGGLGEGNAGNDLEHEAEEKGSYASLEWGRVLIQVAVVTAGVALLDRLLRRRRSVERGRA